ncbi:MAG: molybdopterin molybdotransferase MoeA [Ignavibacteria bacterium]|nr:molybdopterin molybdotransferase MoeA [Ignavibacteria bacterium]
MINAADAIRIIVNSVCSLGSVTTALDRSLGMVLAEDIVSEDDVPPFDNAAMDGYAVRTDNIREVPVILSVVEEIAAGFTATRSLQPGEAMSIMTGAKIVQGCDAVVQLEWTESLDDGQVKILRTISAGHNIRRAGTDIAKGVKVFTKGQALRPQEIGVLASLGRRFVEVYRSPSVAILTTGSEVVELHQQLSEGKIRNSNAHVLAALVKKIGAEPRYLGIAKDDRHDLTSKITEGLKEDVLITSGGISVGKYDLVLEVFRELGVDIKFWKINIRPGMPLLFGLYETKPVFGLPGNPVSTMVTFLQFVQPALLRLMGHTSDRQVGIRARLEEEIIKKDGKRHYVRGIVESRDGSLVVHTTGPQVSNILTSLSKANCLIIIPEEREIVRAGEEVEIELL